MYFQCSNSNGFETLDKSYVSASMLSGSTLNLVHVVSSIRFYSQAVNNIIYYIIDTQFSFNGVLNPVATGGSTNSKSPTTWQTSSFLNLLPSSSPYQTYLFYFSVYNRQLSASEIQQNYQAKLPKSPPIVSSFTQIVQENGIVGDHYNNPSYYFSPIPTNELVIIYLKAYNYDDDPSSPNYVANQTASQQMKVKVFNLPGSSTGQFYDVNTLQVLTNNSIILKDLTTGAFKMYFRPAYGKSSINNGTYTSFSYMGINFDAVQSSTNATASLIVQSIDYPPIASAVEIKTLSRKLSGNIVLSTSNQITGMQILVFPQYGDVYRILQNGTAVLLHRNSNTIIGSPYTLKYIYTGSETNPLSPTIISKDTFTFRLIDTKNHISTNTSCSINVTTAIYATVLTSPSVVQEVLSQVKVSGSDESDLHRNITVKIIKPPSYGNLYNYTSSTNPMKSNDVLVKYIDSKNYPVGTTLYYQGSKGYFTYPNTTWDLAMHGSKLDILPDYFTFVALTLDGSQSDVVTYDIRVLNVNDPTEISFQYPAQWSQANQIKVNSISSKSNSNDQSVIITGFTITDIDRDVDIIKVEIVSSLKGAITLNENHISSLIFNNVDICFSKAYCCCQGDGYSDSSMTFFARPSDLELALNGMKYVSTNPGLDTVNITLYDGSGGNCIDFTNKALQNKGFGSRSIQRGCFVRSTSFSVNVIDTSNGNQQSDLISQQSAALFSIGNVQFTLGILLLAVAGLVFLSCIRSCCVYFFYPKVSNDGKRLLYTKWWYIGYFFFMCCFCPPKKGAEVIEKKKKKKRVFSVWFFIGLFFGICCLCPPKLVDEEADEVEKKPKDKENPFDSSDDDKSNEGSDDEDKIIYYDLSKLKQDPKNLSRQDAGLENNRFKKKSPYERYCIEEETKDCVEVRNDSRELSHTNKNVASNAQHQIFLRPKGLIKAEVYKAKVPVPVLSRLNPFNDLEQGTISDETDVRSAPIMKSLPLTTLSLLRSASQSDTLTPSSTPRTTKDLFENGAETIRFMNHRNVDDNNISSNDARNSFSLSSSPSSSKPSSPPPSAMSSPLSSPSSPNQTKLMRRLSQSLRSSPNGPDDLSRFLSTDTFNLPPPSIPLSKTFDMKMIGTKNSLDLSPLQVHIRTLSSKPIVNNRELRRQSKDQIRRKSISSKLSSIKSIKKKTASSSLSSNTNNYDNDNDDDKIVGYGY